MRGKINGLVRFEMQVAVRVNVRYSVRDLASEALWWSALEGVYGSIKVSARRILFGSVKDKAIKVRR
jgi:hypothetical protein